MARLLLFFIVFIFGIVPAFSQTEILPTENLKIAVAANLLPPMNQIKALYEEEFQSTLTLIVASSGKLTAQIVNGAPYDVFISADAKYSDKIYEEGLAYQKPTVLALGTLYFWSERSDVSTIEQGLQKARTIAIAQPDLAPYGQETRTWLKKKGWWDTYKDKLVYAENVSQVNQYIATEAVEAAFTANSAQYHESASERGKWLPVPDTSPLPNSMVLLRNSEAAEFTVNQFLQFIASPLAQKVFQDFGYKLP